MKNISILCATALAMAMPSVAQAANFGTAGTYVFEGSVEVKKNLPSWTTCDLTLTIKVDGSGAAAADASLSGAFPCSGITFSTPDFAMDGFGNPVSVLVMYDVTTNIPAIVIPPNINLPADACSGDIYALWNSSNPTPREIEFQDPLSDTPGVSGGPNCKIKGTVYQTSGPTNLTITP